VPCISHGVSRSGGNHPHGATEGLSRSRRECNYAEQIC
jgi:hypothetical protein